MSDDPSGPGPADPDEQPPTRLRVWALRLLRFGLPVLVSIAGFVVMLGGSEADLEGGAGIISAGLAIAAVNYLARLSGRDLSREQEEYAREYFRRNGHWPNESSGR